MFSVVKLKVFEKIKRFNGTTNTAVIMRVELRRMRVTHATIEVGLMEKLIGD